MVSGGVVGWEKAEDVLCLSLYACPKMHYVMIMQGATHREARAVGGEPASSSMFKSEVPFHSFYREKVPFYISVGCCLHFLK